MILSTKVVTGILAAAGIAALLGTAAVAADPHHGDKSGLRGGDHHMGQMRHAMRGPAAGGPAQIEQFDANKDGNVTQAEVNQVRTERFAKFDANKDGKLSLQEFEALWLDFTRQQMVRSFQHLDPNGDAAVTQDEYLAPTRNMVTRGDRNNDGQLNQQDARRQGGRHGTPPAGPQSGVN